MGSNTPDASAPAQSPRVWSKRRLRLTGICLLGLIGLGLQLPNVLSSRLGERVILFCINVRIRGRVSWDDLRLSWRGPIAIRGLRVFDSRGREILRTDVDCPYGLWDMLRRRQEWREVIQDACRFWAYPESERAVLLDALGGREADSDN